MLNYQQPDERGHFGPYGGSFVAETLVHALDELKRCYAEVQNDPEFTREFKSELATSSAGRARSTTPRV